MFSGTHMSTMRPSTTVMPTQSPSLPCSLGGLNYDIYLIVDVSASINMKDFAAV